MSYLSLAILCSASIALIFKFSESAGLNRYAVTTVNYVVASLIAVLIIRAQGGPLEFPGSLSAFPDQVAALWRSELGLRTAEASAVWAILVGSLAGLIFFLSFLAYQISVKREGVGLSGAFAKLGILLPMALSLLFWHEIPRLLQWVGMALAAGSILIVTLPTAGAGKTPFKLSLILLFLFGGLAEFSNKIFQKYALVDYSGLFLLTTFGTACLWSLGATIARRRRVTGRDLLTGVAVGVPNLFSSYFLIQALESVPASVAFPVFGAGTILIISLAGAALFGERLKRRDRLAIGLVMLALILINI